MFIFLLSFIQIIFLFIVIGEILSFCTTENQCSENEGDCDIDNECQTGLICGLTCPAPLGFDFLIDCCYDPSSLSNGDFGFCTTSDPCAKNEGDCVNDDQCQGQGFFEFFSIGKVCNLQNSL